MALTPDLSQRDRQARENAGHAMNADGSAERDGYRIVALWGRAAELERATGQARPPQLAASFIRSLWHRAAFCSKLR
jgi:hypothetical protein